MLTNVIFINKGINSVLEQQAAELSLSDHKMTTLQENLDRLGPDLAVLCLTLFCMWLLKKKFFNY